MHGSHSEARVRMPLDHAGAHVPPGGALQGPVGTAAGKARQGAPGSLPERLPASPPGWAGTATPLQAGAPAAAALPARAATAAGTPGWSPTGARTRFGHRVLCPAHGAAMCAACPATGRALNAAAPWATRGTGRRRQRSAQGPGRCVRGFKRPSRCTGLHPPPRKLLGSRGRGSPRGSSEDEPQLAQQRCCRRYC